MNNDLVRQTENSAVQIVHNMKRFVQCIMNISTLKKESLDLSYLWKFWHNHISKFVIHTSMYSFTIERRWWGNSQKIG